MSLADVYIVLSRSYEQIHNTNTRGLDTCLKSHLLPSTRSQGCTVLDLGCGTGRDVFTCAQLVGEEGKVIGIDMTGRHSFYQAQDCLLLPLLKTCDCMQMSNWRSAKSIWTGSGRSLGLRNPMSRCAKP